MRSAELQHLYYYNYWATSRILDTASKLPAGVLSASGPMAHDSLLGTLAHALAGEIVWRVRCQEGRSPTALPGVKEFPDLGALRKRWPAEEAAMRGYLAGLDDSGLDRVVRYRSTLDARDHETPLWQILLHLVNHGTQHRGEAGAELTRLGFSPGDVDYMVYIRAVKSPEPGRLWLSAGPSH